VERDKIDTFLETLHGFPDMDYEVEGIVDRIHSLDHRFRRQLAETLADHDLTSAEWGVLKSLYHRRQEDTCSPGDLSKELELSSGAMTSRLDKLEQRGFIRRHPDPNDRRGVVLELTDAGERAWMESTNAQAKKEALLGGALTKREQRELNALLRKLMLAFDS